MTTKRYSKIEPQRWGLVDLDSLWSIISKVMLQLGCRSLSTSSAMVSANPKVSGGSGLEDNGSRIIEQRTSRMVKKIYIFLWFMHLGSWDGARDRSPDFLSRLKALRTTFRGVITTLGVVSVLSHALKVGSSFSKLGVIPLTKQHVAKVGERIPPSSHGNSLWFWFMWYDPLPSDQERRINGQGIVAMFVGPILHRAVILCAFGSCNLILRHWIMRRESTIREPHTYWWLQVFYCACWWVWVFWPFMHCLFWIWFTLGLMFGSLGSSWSAFYLSEAFT